MQIPQNLQRFPLPTLLVIAGETKALFWLLHHDQANELPTIEIPIETLTDHEYTHTNEGHDDEEHIKHCAKSIAKAVEQNMHDTDAACFYLVMKRKIEEKVMGHLSKQIKSKAKPAINADLLKTPLVEVLGRMGG